MVILILIAMPLIYWALKPLIRRLEGVRSDFDECLKGETSFKFSFAVSVEEKEILFAIVKEFFSPILKVLYHFWLPLESVLMR